MFGDVFNVSITVVCGQSRSEAAGPSMGKAMPRAGRNPLQRRLGLRLPTYAFGAASRRIFLRKHSSFRIEHTSFSACSSLSWDCGHLSSQQGTLPESHHGQAGRFQLQGKCPERNHLVEEFYLLMKYIFPEINSRCIKSQHVSLN